MHRRGRWVIRIALLVLTNSACTKVAPRAVATYYVSATAGSDSNSCAAAQAEATPKQTIGAGWACAQGGGSVLVRGGAYDEQLDSNRMTLRAGSAGAPITIKAYPNETVWWRPSSPDCYAPLAVSHDVGHVTVDRVHIDATNCNEGGFALFRGLG